MNEQIKSKRMRIHNRLRRLCAFVLAVLVVFTQMFGSVASGASQISDGLSPVADAEAAADTGDEEKQSDVEDENAEESDEIESDEDEDEDLTPAEGGVLPEAVRITPPVYHVS